MVITSSVGFHRKRIKAHVLHCWWFRATVSTNLLLHSYNIMNNTEVAVENVCLNRF
jgi:hypothetical protein